jgi:phytol kinase
MIEQILITFLLMLGFLAIILASEFLYKRFKLPTEYTRKGSHIIASLSSLLIIVLIDSHWYILILGLFFFLLLFIGKKVGLFNSIDRVDRKTGGSYLLPVAIYISFFFADILDEKLYFVLPILLLAISDSLAGFTGMYFQNKTKKIKLFSKELNKTYLGSSVFFLSAFLISVPVLCWFNYTGLNCLIWALSISLVSTLTEMLSSRGLDNLTIPLVSILMIWISLNML